MPEPQTSEAIHPTAISTATTVLKGSDEEIWSSMSSLSPDEADVIEEVASPLITNHNVITNPSQTPISSISLPGSSYCIPRTPRNNVLRKVTNLSVDKNTAISGNISATSLPLSLFPLTEQLNFSAFENFEGLKSFYFYLSNIRLF